MITPVLKLHTKEAWRPQPVETAERFAEIKGVPVELSNLPSAGGRMDFPESMRDPTNTPVVGYHRVVEAANLWWHQFWVWYLYNPWEILGVGRHEGDWEFVQIGCVDDQGERPVLMTASQHKTGREARVLALRTGRPPARHLRRARITRKLLHTRRSRRGRGQRARQAIRQHRVARLWRLGDLGRDVGQLDRPGPLARFTRQAG
jgi:hypothetical protein